MEERIDRYKDKNLDLITTPTRVFVTFQHSDAAQTVVKKRKIDLFDKHKMQFLEAKDPSDIIWEQSDDTKFCQRFRRLTIYVLLAVLAIFYIKLLVWIVQTKIEIDYLK